jgi:hypothetical protein
VKQWYREWHRIVRKEDTKRKVFSAITGQKQPAMKPVHFFVCARCGCDKAKEKYNYEQVEHAINNREQPTCSACVPELPRYVDRLKVSEMKLYLAEWKCSPAKSGAKKEDVLAVFRQQCKMRLRENYFRHPSKKDTGVKVASKPRSLELCYKQWHAKNFPAQGTVIAVKQAASKEPSVARAPDLAAKPPPVPVVNLCDSESESDEEFEFH